LEPLFEALEIRRGSMIHFEYEESARKSDIYSVQYGGNAWTDGGEALSCNAKPAYLAARAILLGYVFRTPDALQVYSKN
jgi:hypothetical protein